LLDAITASDTTRWGIDTDTQDLSIDSTGRHFEISLTDGGSVKFEDTVIDTTGMYQDLSSYIEWTDTTSLIATKYDLDTLTLGLWEDNSSVVTLKTPRNVNLGTEDLYADSIKSSKLFVDGAATIVEKLILEASLTLGDEFYDGFNEAGSAGQILSSTGSKTDWIDASGSMTYPAAGSVGITENGTTWASPTAGTSIDTDDRLLYEDGGTWKYITHYNSIVGLTAVTGFLHGSTTFPVAWADGDGASGSRKLRLDSIATYINNEYTPPSIAINDLTDGKTSTNSVFLGSSAGYSDNNGTYNHNTGVGKEALYSNISGTTNTGVGMQSLYLATASGNTAVGFQSMEDLTTGLENVGIGKDAGLSFLTGDYNVFIGSTTSAGSNSDDNTTVIGAKAIGNGSNTVTLGDDNVTDVYMAEDSDAIVHAAAYQLGTDYKIIIFNDTMCGVKISTTDTVRIVPTR
jgi:hypothetical protein